MKQDTGGTFSYNRKSMSFKWDGNALYLKVAHVRTALGLSGNTGIAGHPKTVLTKQFAKGRQAPYFYEVESLKLWLASRPRHYRGSVLHASLLAWIEGPLRRLAGPWFAPEVVVPVRDAPAPEVVTKQPPIDHLQAAVKEYASMDAPLIPMSIRMNALRLRLEELIAENARLTA